MHPTILRPDPAISSLNMLCLWAFGLGAVVLGVAAPGDLPEGIMRHMMWMGGAATIALALLYNNRLQSGLFNIELHDHELVWHEPQIRRLNKADILDVAVEIDTFGESSSAVVYITHRSGVSDEWSPVEKTAVATGAFWDQPNVAAEIRSWLQRPAPAMPPQSPPAPEGARPAAPESAPARHPPGRRPFGLRQPAGSGKPAVAGPPASL